MARIRTIKPDFWTDAKMAKLSHTARLLFIGLLNHADDDGRFKADPRIVKLAVFPLDDDMDSTRIRGVLDELSTMARIRLYEIDGELYGDIPKFAKHQKIDRPTKSRIPQFVEPSTKPRRALAVGSGSGSGSGSGKEQGSAPTDFKKPKSSEQLNLDRVAWTWNGITAADHESWTTAYPAVNQEVELQKAIEWVKGAGPKGFKKNWRKFLTGWFSRCQDRGGTKGGATKSKRYDMDGREIPPAKSAKEVRELELSLGLIPVENMTEDEKNARSEPDLRTVAEEKHEDGEDVYDGEIEEWPNVHDIQEREKDSAKPA